MCCVRVGGTFSREGVSCVRRWCRRGVCVVRRRRSVRAGVMRVHGACVREQCVRVCA